jgi:A/G-specific adenine glycosylase
MGLRVRVIEEWPCVQHTFSHFHLEITPVLALAEASADGVREGRNRFWFNPEHADERGLAAPVERLLRCFNQRRKKG